jgi:hypothetical protein
MISNMKKVPKVPMQTKIDAQLMYKIVEIILITPHCFVIF